MVQKEEDIWYLCFLKLISKTRSHNDPYLLTIRAVVFMMKLHIFVMEFGVPLVY